MAQRLSQLTLFAILNAHPPSTSSSLLLKYLAMLKWLSAELTGLPASSASNVGVGDMEDILFREDAEEEGNILMSKKSRTCRKQMTDNQLFLYFDELLEAQANVLCRNINCSCLKILKEDDRV
jgi:hypothetical protein